MPLNFTSNAKKKPLYKRILFSGLKTALVFGLTTTPVLNSAKSTTPKDTPDPIQVIIDQTIQNSPCQLFYAQNTETNQNEGSVRCFFKDSKNIEEALTYFRECFTNSSSNAITNCIVPKQPDLVLDDNNILNSDITSMAFELGEVTDQPFSQQERTDLKSVVSMFHSIRSDCDDVFQSTVFFNGDKTDVWSGYKCNF